MQSEQRGRERSERLVLILSRPGGRGSAGGTVDFFAGDASLQVTTAPGYRARRRLPSTRLAGPRRSSPGQREGEEMAQSSAVATPSRGA